MRSAWYRSARSCVPSWPTLLQNLRASYATDWSEHYPSHVVAKWLGHSPKVAAQHYLMSRDHHFEDVVNGAVTVPPATVAEGPEGATSCDANSDSARVGIRQHGATRNDRTRSHHPGYRGFVQSYASYQNRLNGWDRNRTNALGLRNTGALVEL